MGKSLEEIAEELKNSPKNVQLIYAFNGVGKTRLSREFKKIIASNKEEKEYQGDENVKVLYYNAFTEDLFYWDNDLDRNTKREMLIHPNSFTDWVLREEGQENNIIKNFQHYTNKRLTPRFSNTFDRVTFSFEGGNQERIENIKISRGEENCFIWCVFYSFLSEIMEVLNVFDPEERSTYQFNNLKYVFIDDPISSLDENHLIELAINIVELIKSSPRDLKFIITTHNPLFYNVIYNEQNLKTCYMLRKSEDGTFELEEKKGDSNKSFSYHLFLKQTIEEAIKSNNIQRYHFTLLRNLYEKTANFLGYPRWSELLPDDKTAYYNRIIQFTSHSTLSNEVVAEPTTQEKQIVKFLFEHLKNNYNFWKEEEEQ